ncbi:hypothetical protein [Parabacteroides sp. PF5-6]|uniref:hypothetical protein n=1 Tax=Parabacteroides sp. PF5-6 TaxID=1742403 RepID=UPI002404CA83|nr:hypothetical protein [Parabacteroides sp. PF5-6]MDF9829345.1 hypothetical protein [Parabacteroides sp. PF5-6]
MGSLDNIKTESTNYGDNTITTVMIQTSSYTAIAEQIDSDGEYNLHQVYVASSGNGIMDFLTGEKYKEALNMLITAVNNRTIERNYFKLYCDLLDGIISEGDFGKEIEENESEYVIDESEEPSVEKLKLAIALSDKLKNVDSVTDLSALFSFNPESLNSLVRL